MKKDWLSREWGRKLASFNAIGSSDQVERRNVAKRFIYLESEEDVQVFKERWFFDLGENVEFLLASCGRGGGCNSVISSVTEDRAKNINAWGIVDRDVLAAKGEWDAFFDHDDNSFVSRKIFGEHIIVLRCWEMENYLLHPDVLEDHLADIHARTPRKIDEVIAELFEIVCCKLVIITTNLLLNRKGEGALPKGFGNQQDCITLLDAVEKRLDEKGIPNEDFEDFLVRMTKFGSSFPSRSLEQWKGLLRIMDGKMLFQWIKDHNALKDEFRFNLATRTRVKKKIADMLDKEVIDLVHCM